ncbi:histidine kinase [Actinomycetes bacterium KLBMP 9797]
MSLATRLRVPPWLQDVLFAAFITFMQVQGTIAVAADEVAALDTVGEYGHAILLAVSGVALAFRRRAPAAVFWCTATASVVYYLADYPDGPGWLAVFVAIYTMAAYADERYVRWHALAGFGTLKVGWIVAAVLHPPENPGWLFFRFGIGFLALSMGFSVRMRRKLIAEAHERAERAERTREEEARRRVDAERLRIAREVHDTVAHCLAVVNVQAGVTAHVLDKRPDQARETLLTIERTSAQALRELRATLGVLHGTDDNRAPAPGLERIDELLGVAREAGLDVRLEAQPPPRELPSAVDRAAYRILQESITNTIRHAGPTRVTVSLAHGAEDLTIRVSDDGRGKSRAAAGAGRGIAGMRERCVLLGGELTAGPRPAGGFEVYARLPVVPA